MRLIFLVVLMACSLVSFQIPTAHYRTTRLPIPGKKGIYTFVLNDTLATPGDVLTSDTAVICHQKTDTLRNVTLSMHKAIFVEYGIDYANHVDYEDDHLISIELGGSNSNKNRWPQPYAFPGAHEKDKVENWIHKDLCKDHKIFRSVQQAQYLISHDWAWLYDWMMQQENQ